MSAWGSAVPGPGVSFADETTGSQADSSLQTTRLCRNSQRALAAEAPAPVWASRKHTSSAWLPSRPLIRPSGRLRGRLRVVSHSRTLLLQEEKEVKERKGNEQSGRAVFPEESYLIPASQSVASVHSNRGVHIPLWFQ